MKRGLIAAAVMVIAALNAVQPVSGYSERSLVAAQAVTAIGDPYRTGAEGPDRFDCSGLVWWSFLSVGLQDRIGGKRLRAREIQSLLRKAGLLYTDPSQVQVGDLAFWGSPAVHVGIVTRITSKGKAWVTSALVAPYGVREMRVDRLHAHKPFSGYGRVDLQEVPDPTQTPGPTPTPSPSPSAPPTATPSPSPSGSPSPTPVPTPTVVYQ